MNYEIEIRTMPDGVYAKVIYWGNRIPNDGNGASGLVQISVREATISRVIDRVKEVLDGRTINVSQQPEVWTTV